MNCPFYPAPGKMQVRPRFFRLSPRLARWLPLLLALALSACAAMGTTTRERQRNVEDFAYTLRWLRFQEGAQFFVAEQREAFLDQMEAVKDLTVVDVRIRRLELKDEGQRAEVRLEMDYYILPSATLKTLRIDQSWRYFEAGSGGNGGFLITTSFPPFPAETSRNKGTGKATLPP